MKRILLLLALCALLLSSSALAEGNAPQGGTLIFPPAADPAPLTPPSLPEGSAGAGFDFSNLTLTDPDSTPIPVDPIDKPTPTPQPTPNLWYEVFSSKNMGVSFNIPGTWLLNPNTNQDTTIQFVEPKSEMMEKDGYQTRITIEKVNTGLNQTAADARDRLESTLDELGSTFTSFVPGNLASASMDGGSGYYCYYKAEYNDGSKNYTMRGRIMIVAKGKALYQLRITTPANWYTYYEHVFRDVRSSFEFL